ncbi:MAG TPA: acetyl-CoA carboxylase biotin carboxyl carrier protein [Pirellulales bacterium]|jgi:acetyl-CoA carboxylase biotin carboxyl carrier protein|nr:acetyl-CoA carboxylase biotin carboxyl carrier protein [Pirellulales bacterium]
MMAGSGSNQGDIFDVKRIRRLVELMNEHELAEIDLRQADQRIRLRKGGEPIVTMGAVRPSIGADNSSTSTASGAASASAASQADANLAIIKSPMIGTFYSSASPETPPFVKVGDHVGPTSPVCIIEAMKVFNEIPAEVSGQVVAVLVENGEPVEFGQPLFKVDPHK